MLLPVFINLNGKLVGNFPKMRGKKVTQGKNPTRMASKEECPDGYKNAGDIFIFP